MRVLVTGGAGMLAHDVLPLLQNHETTAVTRKECDLGDPHAVETLVERLQPQRIFHLAAYTDVDGCEGDPQRATRDNADATENLARAAVAAGAHLLFVSTDYVFDGKATTPIPADAAIRPINEYGRSKRKAEEAIVTAGGKSLIVRTSWLIGSQGKNFVDAIRKRAHSGAPLRVVDDQRGSPTFTPDLAQALVQLGLKGETGVLHLTNSGECTWFDLAVEILRQDGLDNPIERSSTQEIGRPAARPTYSVLDNSAAIAILGKPLPEWQSSLSRYLKPRAAEV